VLFFETEPTDRSVWGIRTAHFRDPDGNLIEINHALKILDQVAKTHEVIVITKQLSRPQ